MIDRFARRALAENVRHLASGVITNREFETRIRMVLKSRDAAVREVFWSGAWQLYDGFDETRFRGSAALSPNARNEIARWIMFLQSDLPYEWPVRSRLSQLAWVPLHLATLGISVKIRRNRFKKSGDISAWPFVRRSDQCAASRTPTYLRGPSL